MKISGLELKKIIQEEVTKYLKEEETPPAKAEASPEQNDKMTAQVIEKLNAANGLAALQRVLPNSEEALVAVLQHVIKNATRVNKQNKANAIRKMFANVRDIAASPEE